MPQLDVLIWLNLAIATTICFWCIYFVILRLFLVNYQLILNLRLKFKKTVFNVVYVILVLLFNYNFQSIKLLLKAQNLVQKINIIFCQICTKFSNIFIFLLFLLKVNFISELFIPVHSLYYSLNFNKNLNEFIKN